MAIALADSDARLHVTCSYIARLVPGSVDVRHAKSGGACDFNTKTNREYPYECEETEGWHYDDYEGTQYGSTSTRGVNADEEHQLRSAICERNQSEMVVI